MNTTVLVAKATPAEAHEPRAYDSPMRHLPVFDLFLVGLLTLFIGSALIGIFVCVIAVLAAIRYRGPLPAWRPGAETWTGRVP